MAKRVKRKSEFSVVETIIVVAVLVVVGLSGYFFMNHSKPKNKIPPSRQAQALALSKVNETDSRVFQPLNSYLADHNIVLTEDTTTTNYSKYGCQQDLPDSLSIGPPPVDVICTKYDALKPTEALDGAFEASWPQNTAGLNDFLQEQGWHMSKGRTTTPDDLFTSTNHSPSSTSYYGKSSGGIDCQLIFGYQVASNSFTTYQIIVEESCSETIQ